MSRKNTHRSASTAVGARIRPLARNAGAAARRQSGRARAWAAPQLEHAGQTLQENIAPKAAALLSAAARRVEPARQQQRQRWRKLVGASAITATVSALAAATRRRANGADTAPDPEDANNAVPDPEDANNAGG